MKQQTLTCDFFRRAAAKVASVYQRLSLRRARSIVSFYLRAVFQNPIFGASRNFEEITICRSKYGRPPRCT